MLADRQAIQILDVRDAAAFQHRHLPGARHLPLERLRVPTPWVMELRSLDPSVPTVVY